MRIELITIEIPSDKLWRIYLRFTDEPKEIQFNVNRSDTISQLKTKIRKYKGIPIDRQLLLLHSKPLSDDLVIESICKDLSMIVVWDTTPLKKINNPPVKSVTDPESQFRESAQLHLDELPINKLKQPSRQNSVPVILFFNGTFCPIHAGHINTMQTAKNYLESTGVSNFPAKILIGIDIRSFGRLYLTLLRQICHQKTR